MAGEEEKALDTFEKALRLREDIRPREAPLEIHVQEFREMTNLPAST